MQVNSSQLVVDHQRLGELMVESVFISITPEIVVAATDSNGSFDVERILTVIGFESTTEHIGWIAAAIARIAKQPKPLPITEALLLDLRRELLNLISDFRLAAGRLNSNKLSIAEAKRLIEPLQRGTINRFFEYFAFDERRHSTINEVIFRLRKNSYRKNNIRIIADFVKGFGRPLHSLLDRIEEKIEFQTARERINEIARDARTEMQQCFSQDFDSLDTEPSLSVATDWNEWESTDFHDISLHRSQRRIKRGTIEVQFPKEKVAAWKLFVELILRQGGVFTDVDYVNKVANRNGPGAEDLVNNAAIRPHITVIRKQIKELALEVKNDGNGGYWLETKDPTPSK